MEFLAKQETPGVGASSQDSGTGAAYVFERDIAGWDGWGQAAKLSAGDGHASDDFGIAVGVSNTAFAVGAWMHDHRPGDKEPGSGAAYIFVKLVDYTEFLYFPLITR